MSSLLESEVFANAIIMSSLLELEFFANAIAVIEQDRSVALDEESPMTTRNEKDDGPMNELDASLLPDLKYPHTDESDDGENHIGSIDTTNNTMNILENENKIAFSGDPILKMELKYNHSSQLCCAICLADFEEGDILTQLLPCHHSFHKECIYVWITKRKRRCPLCMTVVRVENKTQRTLTNKYYAVLQRNKLDFVVCRVLLLCSLCWAAGLLLLYRFRILEIKNE